MTLLDFAIGMLLATPIIVLVNVLIARHNAREWCKSYEEHVARMDAIHDKYR